MQIFSILGNHTALETWDIRDKQGSAVFSDVKVMDIGVEDNGTVVAAPIEENSFASYNKTSESIQITATLAFQGTAQYLQSKLEVVKKYKKSMDKLSIVTPYAEYEDMTIESYSYTKDVTNGNGVLYIPCVFREVLEVTAAYSKTDASELPPPISESDSANPGDASTQDTGMTTTTQGNSQQQQSAKRSRSTLKDIKDSL